MLNREKGEEIGVRGNWYGIMIDLFFSGRESRKLNIGVRGNWYGIMIDLFFSGRESRKLNMHTDTFMLLRNQGRRARSLTNQWT